MSISLRVLALPPVNEAERGEVVEAPVNVKVISMDIGISVVMKDWCPLKSR